MYIYRDIYIYVHIYIYIFNEFGYIKEYMNKNRAII